MYDAIQDGVGKTTMATPAISPIRGENFPEWYQQVIREADLAEHAATVPTLGSSRSAARCSPGRREAEDLVARDPYAPELGTPNHGRYVVLESEFDALTAALTKSARPVTAEGNRVLAGVVMLYADRTSEDRLGPEDFASRLRPSTIRSHPPAGLRYGNASRYPTLEQRSN